VIIGPPVHAFRFVGNSSVFTNSLFRRRQHHNFLRLELRAREVGCAISIIPRDRICARGVSRATVISVGRDRDAALPIEAAIRPRETASVSLPAVGDLMAILPGSFHPTSDPRLKRVAPGAQGDDDYDVHVRPNMPGPKASPTQRNMANGVEFRIISDELVLGSHQGRPPGRCARRC
jgi:hypothetical protein